MRERPLLPPPRWRDRTTTARRARAAAIAIACALAFPSSAHATGAPPSDAKSAEELANKAYAEHAAGKDSEAIATYLKAYELAKLSVFLYNIATICDRTLHERDLAMEYYRRYAAAPDAEPALVQKATERLAALKAEKEAAAQPMPGVPAIDASKTASAAPPPAAPAPPPPSPTPAPAESPPPHARSSALRPVGVVVGAVGVAGIAASVVLGFVAKGKSDAANAFCSGASCTNPRGVSDAHDAGTFANAGNVTFIGGAALTVVGVVMFLVAPRSPAAKSGAASLTLAPTLGPGTGGMGLAGTF